MKRSEMIKAIAKEFYALTAHGEQLAEEALSFFEAQGMLPPLVDSEDGLPYWNRRVWDETQQKFIHRIPQWDLEDEAK